MWIHFLLACCVVVSEGCALTQDVTGTPRSVIEQLLLTQSVEHALAELSVPIPEGAAVTVKATGLLERTQWDLEYIRNAVSARLGTLGYTLKNTEDDSTYLVHVQVESMGTNQGRVFIGMPPVQSVLIPFSLPQLTLYQKLDQLAHVRLHLDLYHLPSGRFSSSTTKVASSTYYNQYVVLFFISFRKTDLIDPPL